MRDVLADAWAELVEGKCFGWAASLAFYSFLALFPALLFVVSLAGVLPVDHLLDRMIAALSRVAPGDVVAIARLQFAQIAHEPRGDLLAISLLAALWSTSSGMTALVDTLNQAHRVIERRAWWRVRLMAIGLTVTLSAATLIAFALVIVGPAAGASAADWLSLGGPFLWVANLLRWPIAFALIVCAIACVYHFAPDITRRRAWFTPGAVVAATLWLIVSVVFRAYVSRFADYQKTFGAIGGVIVALLWFYMTSLAILIGAQLDAAIERAAIERSPGSDG
jgi:membrane protein